MKDKALTFLFSLILVCACTSDKKVVSIPDRYLIIPGKTAEGYNLYDKITEDISKRGLTEKKKLSDIFDVEVLPDLQFENVVYVRDSHALFLNNHMIVAIAGFKITKRVTSEAVLLSKGVDNFIINYGNDGLRIITHGRHKAYIYQETGIAVFDDNSDNAIDMYLVFHLD